MLLAAQGTRLEDGTYVYTCGKCHGRSTGEQCDWCYGGDLDRIVEEMQKGARGQRYYSLLKRHLAITGKQIVDEWKQMKAEQGSLKVPDIGYLSLKYRLNFKATWEWLEENFLVKISYGEFEDGPLKVRDVYAAAREKYPELRTSDKGSQAREKR
jgi:hypothetical protein